MPTVTTGGTVEITEQSITTSSPVGFVFAGQEIIVTTTGITGLSPTNPLVLVFRMLQSLIPGETENTIQLFKNGVQVENCLGSTTASPDDPCVSSRAAIGDDFELTILTSTASSWNFGVAAPTPPPVGGIAEVLVDSSAPPAGPADSSGPSAALYATIAGGIAAAAVAAATGGWYARRRFRQ